MSSLARRSLRATAAVAGIAAVGLGIVIPAFAAPAPGPDGGNTAPTPPDGASTPNVVDELPKAPVVDLADPPPLFTFEVPSVHTADAQLPAAATDTPSPAHAGDVIGFDETNDIEYDVESTAPQDQIGAMQHLDAASTAGRLAEQLLSSTQSNDIRP